ncbi:MAG TPA: acylphosphatase [Gemmatimonadales bacterium]|nr:acylphosphatase [Gemmatimonadales bacterium]
MSGLRAVRLQVEGMVQGVGFRWYVLSRAQALGVRGWVRNRDDGSVEVVALATPETIHELIEVVREGPPGADVYGVTVEDISAELVTERSFRIKH